MHMVKEALAPKIKSTKDSIKKLKAKLLKDIKTENWLGLSETARTLHARQCYLIDVEMLQAELCFRLELQEEKK